MKHWEGGCRIPEVAARAYLTVIDKNPGAIIDALGTASGRYRTADAKFKKTVKGKSRPKRSHHRIARK